MLRSFLVGCGPRSVHAAAVASLLLALNGACSTQRQPDVRVGGQGGGAGVGPIDNPGDGGQIWTGDGATCAPDDDTCIDETPLGAPDGATPPDGPADSGDPHVTPSDGGVEPGPDAEIDAQVVEPEPDAEIIDPDEDGGIIAAKTYKIDLLFVVDNSNSMQEEQAALRAQFPMLISRLLANTAIGGGEDVVAGAQDIHLGVVSSDMGLPGLPGIEGCDGLGDNGILNGVSSLDATGCSMPSFAPPFLSYVAGSGEGAQLATDLGCISTLGTDGCGFEQQLESMLKAVWPGGDPRITFVNDPATGFGATGQAGPGFPNGDFVRHDGGDEVSVLAVVVVTDEEDCSSSNMAHFAPNFDATGLNTRCHYAALRPEPNAIFDVSRYVDGLRLLRPGYEQRVVFGAIVGVPPELVTEEAMRAVDFDNAASRTAHYNGILNHPAMQNTIDGRGTEDLADDNLLPSCETPSGRAYPPRRIVQVARGFGAQGFVQSICESDWSYAMELLATRVARARSE